MTRCMGGKLLRRLIPREGKASSKVIGLNRAVKAVGARSRARTTSNRIEAARPVPVRGPEQMVHAEQVEAEQQKKMSPEMIEQLKALGYM